MIRVAGPSSKRAFTSSAARFGLSPTDQDELYQAGREAAEQFRNRSGFPACTELHPRPEAAGEPD